MADVITTEELAADGGVMTDIPGVVGLGGGQLENFPANPDMAAAPPMPALPQVTPLDPGDLTPEPAATPETETPPVKEPEPAKEPEVPAEAEAPAEPERLPWDRKRQESDQKAATERRRRETAEAENAALKERLDRIEAQAETRTKTTAPQPQADTEFDFEKLQLVDDMGDPIPNAEALKLLAQQNRALHARLNEVGEHVNTLTEAQMARADSEQKQADHDAYFGLLDQYTKGRTHIRNELVDRIDAEYEAQGYDAENHPDAVGMNYLIRGLAAEVFAEMPAPKATRAKTTIPKAPTKPVNVGEKEEAGPRTVRRQVRDVALEMHKNKELFDPETY